MKMLHAKGMLSKSYLGKSDDSKQKDRNMYSDNYFGMGGQGRRMKEDSKSADAVHAKSDGMYPAEYMKGTKDYKCGMGRSTKRIMGGGY